MKYLFLVLFSFNVFADAESDRIAALEVRFAALEDIKLSIEKCGYTFGHPYRMKKDMIASKDNTILECLESKNQEVKDFIQKQETSDNNAKAARLFFKTANCESESGIMVRNMCLIFQKGQ